MKKTSKCALRALGVALLAVLVTLPAAEEAAAEEAPRDAAQAPAPEPPKIDVTGFVDVYYLYNFNRVDPALRSFDVQHNAFSHAPRERQAQPRRLSRQRLEQQQ